jgi:hypothetical protein
MNTTTKVVQFVSLTELGLSEECKDAITGNSNLTYGDATHSLFSPQQILTALEGDDDLSDKDYDILDKLQEENEAKLQSGNFPVTYIDLES